MKDYPKVDVGNRVLAAVIDGVMSYIIGFIPIIGAIIGAAYMLLKDGLFEGQSIGKKVMKLQVITEGDVKADFAVSARRNVIFAIPVIVMIVPVLGWIVAPILGLVILIIELLKVINEPKGRRIGDTWAGTQVIKYEEAGQAIGASPAKPPAESPPPVPEQPAPEEPTDNQRFPEQDQ